MEIDITERILGDEIYKYKLCSKTFFFNKAFTITHSTHQKPSVSRTESEALLQKTMQDILKFCAVILCR
jgi:hypothetical protein